jgi:hypothetical protein
MSWQAGMAQVFHRSFNTIYRAIPIALVLGLMIGGSALFEFYESPWATGAKSAVEQPVPFSHAHHVGRLGIDCRYCHSTVEESSFAGMPPTKTCMNCHSQIWFGSDMLEPVRASYRSGQPIQWQRVHNLPDFVYFDHSIHIQKGIGCATCHGRVDRMPLMWQAQPLTMAWCLDCHRQPERFVRPREKVFDMSWQADDQAQLGARLVKQYHVKSKTSCSTCHR